LPSVAAAVNA
jgi:hypothetical protein